MSEEAHHVRANTAHETSRKMDEESAQRIAEYAQHSAEAITRRIEELDREWDIERILEMNASALAFTGLMLGITRNKKWLILPSIVLPFLFQHAVQGWCPPLPILRRLGVRSRKEIDREKTVLRALRGDFRNASRASSASAIKAASE